MADDARLRTLFLGLLDDETRPTFEADETLEVRLASMLETAEAALGTFMTFSMSELQARLLSIHQVTDWLGGERHKGSCIADY